MNCKTDPHLGQLYASVSRMTRLRRLWLVLIGDENVRFELTPKSLSPLKRLTHLKFQFEWCIMNASFLDSIHTYLSQIQSVDIDVESVLYGTPNDRKSITENLPKLKYFRF